MTDLTSRITAALDEQQRLAEAATPGPWTTQDEYRPVQGRRCLSCFEDKPIGKSVPEIDGPPGADVSPTMYEPDAAFIAANDPSSVLRRVAAQRRTLERHAPVEATMLKMLGPWCRRCVGDWPCSEIDDLADAVGVDVTGVEP